MECIKLPTHSHMTGYQTDHCHCDKCNEAGQTYQREWHRKNRTPEQKARYRRTARVKRMRWLASIKMEKGCSICGYREHPSALDFHHVDPATKSFSISAQACRYSQEKMEREIAKCVVVCANCHRISFSNQRYEE